MNIQTIEDEKILSILKRDSQKGMVLLMEKYTGLVWHVISFHINNPEDIKECINDTFSSFYFQRKNYNPEKASLPAYLTIIARRLAISCYRAEHARREKNLRLIHNPNDELQDDPISLAETRIDLERAISMLNPNEIQIIRMKYYDGMTVKEIADSLNLPYETVKKRHQRSIFKLSRAFLLVLLLVLSFSVCVYGVLRYFDIIPSISEWSEEMLPEKKPVPEDIEDVKPLTINNPSSPHLPDNTSQQEIGRASCRERV